MRRVTTLLIAIFLMSLSQMAIAMSQYGPTQANENLYDIARKHGAVKGVSVEKMVLVIKTINPRAMKNGHELKSGVLLKIPASKAEVEQAFRNPTAVQAMPAKVVAKAAPIAKTTAVPAPQPAPQTEAKVEAPAVIKPPKPVPAPIIIKDQAAIEELKKTFNFEHSERMKVEEKADQLASLVRDDKEQIRTLEQETDNLKGSFPWAWVWFLSFFGLMAYLAYAKRRTGSFILSGGRLAAARLGVTRADPPGSKVQSYPTKRFDDSYQQYSMDRRLQAQEGHGAALADAMIDMAEGNGSAAEVKLKAQIDKEPDNIELRMKLLEVYIEQNNREKFKVLADDLLANLISEEDPEWARIQAIYLSKWVYD